MEKENFDLDLFMMCLVLDRGVLLLLFDGYYVRSCWLDELMIWKVFLFDELEDVIEYEGFMIDFFNKIYGGKEELFFWDIFFVCDELD